MTALREQAREIFADAMQHCGIERAFSRRVRVEGTRLFFCNEEIDLEQFRHIRVIAVGKAAAPMLDALLPRLSGARAAAHGRSQISDIRGMLIAPQPPSHLAPGFQYFAGGHPLPNQSSFEAARTALAMLQGLPQRAKPEADTLCLFAISGGASAMMELPLDPSISLADTITFHRALVHSGASIADINCVRKHFSAVKGGRLALAAGNAICLSILIADVPPQELDALGSGPTIADSSTVDECRAIVARHHLLEQFPGAVREFFSSATLPETPKAAEFTSRACLLLDASDLAAAARQKAQQMGFHVVIDNGCDDWDYAAAAQYLIDRLRELRREHDRVCLISVGEVTVHVPEQSNSAVGIGGRNQQFALYAASLLGPSDGRVAILSAGSDGLDGNSPAAGAVLDEKTLVDSAARVQLALTKFDAYPLLASAGAAVVTGPTGNNLRDLRLLLSEPDFAGVEAPDAI